MTFLIVDDSRTMRNIQKKALAAIGVTDIAEAEDGVQGLAAFQARPGAFTMVLLDWNMPNMNGLELAAKIREIDQRVLMMMVTTEAERSRVLDAVRAGVNNYLMKPFTTDQLIERVNQTLDRAKLSAPLARAA